MKDIVKITLIGVFVLSSMLQADRFEKRGDEVYDSDTKLAWQRVPSSNQYKWQQAIKYCQSMGNRWRLPNLYELKSLVDYSRYNPAISTDLIEIKTDDSYWTSSVYKNSSSSAWIVSFRSGNDFWYDKSFKDYALCVRG